MGGSAWVTLATNDSYSLGALVLAHSLRRVGTKHDLAVLVTPGVTGAMREKLSSVFSLVQEVNVLDSKDEANLALLARPELGITFTKLHCWRLTQYEKCVFVDADTLVIRNCDELFDREELSAAPDVGWPDCFNSGVFVFKPSQQTFASLTSFAAAKGSFDGGDQGLLNQYFSDWAHKDISKHLPFIYNMCSTATYSYLPAYKQFGDDVRIIHFIGITKPWLQYFDTVTSQVQPAPGSHHLLPLLQLWWNIFCDNVHPQLSPIMASSILAQHWHEQKFPSAQSHDPIEPSFCDTNETTGEKFANAPTDFSEFRDPWESYHSADETTPNLENDNTYIENDKNQEYIVNDPQPLLSGPLIVDILLNVPRHVSHSDFSQENHQNFPVLEKLEQRPIQENFTCPNPENHSFHSHYANNESQEEKTRISFDEYCPEHNIEEKHEAENYRTPTNSTKTPENDLERKENFDWPNFHGTNVTPHRDETQSNFHHPHFCNRENESKFEHTTNFSDQKPSEIERVDVASRDRHPIDQNTGQTDSNFKPTCPTLPLPCTKSNNVTTQSETNNLSQLESNDAGIAGALAQITLGEARSQEQVAFEEHMRKQSWEQGEIDYMGHDSFDNIWKKISQTLSIQPASQPSPPKSVPQPEKIEIEKEPPAPVADKGEPAASKTEAAVLAELERTDKQDGLIDEVAHELKELLSPLTELTRGGTSESTILTGASLSEVAATTSAPLTKASPLVSLPEIPATSEVVGSIAPTSCDVKIPAAIESPDDSKIVKETTLPQAPLGDLAKCEKVDKNKEKTANIEILSESQVPIQVAESVLEADVKESVSEDLKPVTEEAFSSISQTAQESVPAVLETAIVAGHSIAPRSNGSASLIGNGIGDLCSPANGLASATIAIVEKASDTVEPAQSPDFRGPVVLPAEPSNVGKNAPAETAQPIRISSQSSETLEKPETHAPLESAPPTGTLQNIPPAQSTETSADPPTESQESNVIAVEPIVCSPIPQTVSVPIEKSRESSSESVSTPASITETAKVAEEPKTMVPAPSDVSAEPAKTEKAEASVCPKVDQPKIPEAAPIETKPIVCPVKPAKKSQESSEKTEKSGTSTELPVSSSISTEQSPAGSATEDILKKPDDKSGEELKISPSQNPEEPINKKDSKASATEETCEKSTAKKDTKETLAKKVPKALIDKDALKVSIGQEIPKDSAEKQVLEETIEKSDSKKSIEASSEESSPVRPARTKELQIPGTPTIIEATPPTSPPIGGAESLEEQQQTSKVTKKTVKKVVKKTAEAKAADGNEPEAEGKKVTKKIVKKVVKKKDEDGNSPADATSTSEKPKKIVKIVKKTTTTKTTSQTLDAEASVPETPPPGVPEVPVPPKRKIKTTTKTTSLKSDSEQ